MTDMKHKSNFANVRNITNTQYLVPNVSSYYILFHYDSGQQKDCIRSHMKSEEQSHKLYLQDLASSWITDNFFLTGEHIGSTVHQ